MLEKLKGKRTYLTMAVIIILGVINSWNDACAASSFSCINIVVPEWIFVLLGSLGIYTRKIANK